MAQTFKVGQTDPYIVKIQRILNKDTGAGLKKDGNLGPGTSKVLAAWQETQGLPTTGIYDEMTAAVMDPVIELLYLNESDFQNAASELGISVARVKAVQSVESSGYGFQDNGKPTILFERHYFYKLVNAKIASDPVFATKLVSKLKVSKSADIFNALTSKYSDIYNPKAGGYSGGSGEYARLDKAKSIDEDCACRSASWGLFQIMGNWAETLGYKNGIEMAAAFSESEGKQLMGFCSFVKANSAMWSALKKGDYAGFASRYNGSNYKINNYDVKIQQAEAKFK